MKKYFKGEEYEIVGEINDCYEFITKNCETMLWNKKFFYDTKEESLTDWKIYCVQEANTFHNIKFGKQDKELCIKKLYEETEELLHELEAYLEAPEDIKAIILDNIQDEYGDVIQSGLGLFNLKETFEKNFKKIGPRNYPDNFKHKESKNEKN